MHAGGLRLRLTFDGTFDLDDALRTAGQLEGAIHGTLVSLDFAHCHQVDPTGLAHLAETIVGHGGRVELFGLSRHDLRILHYLVGPLDTAEALLEETD